MVSLLEILVLGNLIFTLIMVLIIAGLVLKLWLFERILKEVTARVMGEQKKTKYIMTPNGPVPIIPEQPDDKKEKEDKADYFG